MIHRRHPNRIGFVHWFLIASLGSGWLLTPVAVGQDAEAPKPKAAYRAASAQRPATFAKAKPADPAAPEDIKRMEVYRLRHIDFQLLASLMNETFPDCMIGLNDKSNSLIVNATREDHDRLKELLKTIDVPPDPDQIELMIVYPLRHADCDTVGRLIATVLPKCQFSFDQKANSIIAIATREGHDRMAELIETLDVAPEPNQIKVFRLINNQAADLVEVLVALLDDEKTKISIDQRTNSIIASGTPESLEIMEALLLRFDESSAHEVDESATYQVRIIWLASGLGEGAAPAEDLQGVIEELAKVGVVDLQQVCQVTVNTTADGDFEVQCSPRLDQEPVSLQISGELSHRQRRGKLEIALVAEMGLKVKDSYGRTPASKLRQLVNIETTIRLPDGHFAVLGSTPIEQLTSVFVVQVVPSEK